MSAPESPERDGWREPAGRLKLRWGAYRPRLLVGLALICVGTGLVLVTSAYSLPFLLAGSLLQPAGWAVLPSTIGRRVAVVVPVLGFTWLMLGGASFAWCFAVPLAAWLLVRLRPLVSYAVLALPIASSVVLARVVPDYSMAWVSVLVSTFVVVAAAWLARWGAFLLDSRQSVRPLRNQLDRLD
ncbi:hypothetical protein [Leifsonia sp. NPDC058248]|uniref:hypothetical protein n=1 Tax=Leifsonia sp. NPDC058248 TaxID=3346402 RepID=UPI0036DA03CD